MIIFKDYIDKGKWSVAFEKGLLQIAAFSNIEYADTEKSDGSKFKDWFKYYAIDKFDQLINNCDVLKNAKLRGKNITADILKNIKINGHITETNVGKEKETINLNFYSLQGIFYKIRCSDFHTQTREITDVTIDGKNVIFRLIDDEDNIFEYKKIDNIIIDICPQFFCWLIYYSINNYIKNYIKTGTNQHNRYEYYLKQNVDSVYSTLHAEIKHDFTLMDGLYVDVFRNIDNDADLEEFESSFIIKTPVYQMDIRFDQIIDFQTDEKNKILNIFFNEPINGCSQIKINLENPKFKDLQYKLNNSLN